MTNAPRYYTLLLRTRSDAPWEIHFGDYDRETVRQEHFDAIRYGYRRDNVKLIESSDRQADIAAAVAELNRSEQGAIKRREPSTAKGLNPGERS